jgi:response regulator RpfG family c-di-GMP phosphodiesterase
MFKVLIADDEEDIRDILSSIIESQFDAEIIAVSCGADAIEILEENDDIDLIITDYSMPNGNGGEVYEFNKKSKNVPIFMVSGGYLEDYPGLGDFYESNSKNLYINKPVDFASFIKAIEGILNNDERDELYCFVKSWILESYPPVSYEVHMRIGDEKYVKVKNSNDPDLEEFNRYKGKAGNTFYLKCEDYPRYIQGVISSHQEKIINSPAVQSEIDCCGKSLEIMHESLKVLGLSEALERMVLTTIESCVKKIEDDKVLNKELQVVLESEGYFVSHSFTSIFLASMIAKKLELRDSNTLKKISYAGLLHDLGLHDPEKLSSVINLNSDFYLEASKDCQDIIKKHPSEAVKMFENSSQVPSDSLLMIRDHHENPAGTGFPKGGGFGKLGILSIIFSMSIVIADHLYYRGASFQSLNLLLTRLKELGYDKPEAIRVYNAFRSMIIKD